MQRTVKVRSQKWFAVGVIVRADSCHAHGSPRLARHRVVRHVRHGDRTCPEAPTRARTRSAGIQPLRRRGSCDASCSRKPLLSTTTKRPFPWTVVASTFPS